MIGHELWRDDKLRLFIDRHGYICIGHIDGMDYVGMTPQHLYRAAVDYAGARVTDMKPASSDDLYTEFTGTPVDPSVKPGSVVVNRITEQP